MNKKQIVILCAALAAVAAIVVGIAVAMIGKAPVQMEVPETTAAAETTTSTDPATDDDTTSQTEDAEETVAEPDKKEPEVEVIASEPDSITLQVKDETGETIQVQIGAVDTDIFPEDGENNDSQQPTNGNTSGDEEKPSTGGSGDASGSTDSTQPGTSEKPSEPAPEGGSATEPSVPDSEKETTPTAPDSTDPTEETKPEYVKPVGPDTTTTYEEYTAMSAEEQLLFYFSFADADSFYKWYNEALAEYEANKGDIVVGDDMNMEDIFNN